MTRCTGLEELLGPWVDEEMDDVRRRELEDHLRGCSACAGEARLLAELDEAAARAFTPPPVSEAGWEETWRRVQDELRGEARPLEAAGRRWWPAAAAAAVVLGAVAVSLWFLPGQPVPVYAELHPGVVEYLEAPSEGYVSALYVGEGEVPVVYVTEVE